MATTNLPHFKLTVGESEDDIANIYQTSLVKNPATERLWSVFSSDVQTKSKEVQKNLMVFKSDSKDWERLVSGVWFMPDTPYYRRDESGFEFTVSMDKDELKKALKNHLKMNASNYHNVEHTDALSVWGLVAIEHWIIESADTKSPVMGYSLMDLGYSADEIPLGTVMKTLYIRDRDMFDNMIKPDANGDAQLKGFSIEGLFDVERITTLMKQQKQTIDKMKEVFSKLGLDQESGTIVTNEGKKLTLSTQEISYDGKAVIDGEFKTAQGFCVVVKDSKVVDFGFENEVPAVAEVATEPVVTTEVPKESEVVAEKSTDVVVEPVVTTETDVQKELDKAKAESETLKAEIATLTDTLKAEIAALKAEKEEALKATPIPQATVDKDGKPSDFSNERYNVTKVGGQTFYVPKRK
jgi:hypothetical protein